MPVTLDMEDGKVAIRAIISRPFIYLDNWAINKLLSDQTFRKELIRVLTVLQGTLAISVISIVEIFRRADKKQILEIINILGTLDIVFMNINPSEVIENEKSNRAKGLTVLEQAPWLDEPFMKAMVFHKKRSLTPLSPKDILEQLKSEIDSGAVIKPDSYAETLVPMLEKGRTDVTVIARAKKRLKDRKSRFEAGRPHTSALFSYITDQIIVTGMSMPNSEWNDALHTIVPTCYCDFILLDGRWKSIVEQSGLRSPDIAHVFTNGEEKEFVKLLREFKI